MTLITAVNSEGYVAPIGLAADATIFTLQQDGELAVLLIRRQEAPAKGIWCLPGGFVGEPESPEETVVRKLQEKTGLEDPGYIEQLKTYADPGRDSRGWLPSVVYLALVPQQQLSSENHEATWTPLGQVPPLAFDHNQILAEAVERLRGKLWYSNIAVGLLPDEFTLSEARKVYEALAGQAYDPANFRRDLKASGMIVSQGDKKKSEGRGRPAEVFAFASKEAAWGPTYAKGTKS